MATDVLAVIVQARTRSSRLPGKVMAPILGRPLLAYQLERLARVRADVVVVATTTHEADDPIAALARSMGVVVYRGSEDDVLDRFVRAARAVGADIVVRVTADCPLLDPALVDATVAFFRQGFDYAVPVGLPDGMNHEVLSRALLETMGREATDPADREHVTMFALRRPTRFRLGRLRYTDRTDLRFTVDEPDDLVLVRRLIESLYPRTPLFSYADILWTFSGHPAWAAINGHVRNTVHDLSPIL